MIRWKKERRQVPPVSDARPWQGEISVIIGLGGGQSVAAWWLARIGGQARNPERLSGISTSAGKT